MRMYFFRRLLAVLPVILVFSCHSKQPADMIVYHGKVYTVDSAFSIAEAFAVKDGKILEENGLDDGVTALTQLGLIRAV